MKKENENKKILTEFAKQSDTLFEMGVIRTDSFTGEIGEYVASKVFSLKKTARVTRAVDGIDNKGYKYQIKAKVTSNDSLSYNITNLNIKEIDYLVVVYFDVFYNPKRIIRIKSKNLLSNKTNISKKFLSSIDCDIITNDEIKLPKKSQIEILKFGYLYELLREKEIVRSRRIVGDLGEYYACKYLNLKLNENKNEKGVDAYDEKGRKYEVKTRRVYESGRRTSKTRRLNNLAGKDSEFLIVVVLNKTFECAGMWKMKMKDIENKKSANLRVVNTTKNVEIIVKTDIEWLKY